jgi:hypothetical protein
MLFAATQRAKSVNPAGPFGNMVEASYLIRTTARALVAHELALATSDLTRSRWPAGARGWPAPARIGASPYDV